MAGDRPAGQFGPADSPGGRGAGRWDKGLPPGREALGADLFGGDFPLPVAVLSAEAVDHNIATMARYCAEHGALLAPHGKTSMSPQLIGRQLAAGAWAVTVATAWQAGVLAGHGVRRLLLANQVVDPGSLRLLDRLLHTVDDLVLYCYADSDAALDALAGGIGPAARPRLRVLVELGVPGGRTGLRDDDAALALARRVVAGELRYGGVAAFEGVIVGTDLADTLGQVDRLADRLGALASAIHAAGLTGSSDGPIGESGGESGDDPVPVGAGPIVTVGGSAYFDRVTARLPGALAGTGHRLVLRSGCYLTHDAGTYHQLSPFGARPRAAYRLREALTVWAPVLSRPEPGRALAGLGRRDASADAGLPVPRLVRDRAGRVRAADPRIRVPAVNDQHAFLDLPPEAPLAVGDLVGFGISHPCTTFDKWRAIPIVDTANTVVDVARTYF
ncbi:alanine racemase [Solwaraspora sp. WMMB335]|uniref:alanine racemase n=1 Tax=Solwaraspora sp. WMMB335 TaxID=3404118 RepID=UPI003B960CA5